MTHWNALVETPRCQGQDSRGVQKTLSWKQYQSFLSWKQYQRWACLCLSVLSQGALLAPSRISDSRTGYMYLPARDTPLGAPFHPGPHSRTSGVVSERSRHSRMDNADPYQVLLRASHTIKLFPTPSLLSTMGPAMSFVISRVMSLWKTRPDRRGIVRPDWTITNDHHTYLAERVRVPGGQSHLLYPISQTSCRSPQGHVV